MNRAPLAPKYWPAWAFVGLMWLATRLPYRVQLALGGALGALMFRTIKRWRFYTRRNLRQCFPELDDAAVERLAREHFRSLGIAVFEVAMAWWLPEKRLRKLLDVQGLEHLERARAGGRGVILLTGHFTAFEIGARMLSTLIPLDVMYRENAHPVLEYLIQRTRNVHAETVVRDDDPKRLIRRLREGGFLWYAPDEAHTGPNSAMVPFFGHPAPTNTATSRVAQAGRAAVVPYYPERLPDGRGYRIHFLPALEDFPGDDSAADATRTNRVLEANIRKVPAQYVWVLDRFNTRAHRHPANPDRSVRAERP